MDRESLARRNRRIARSMRRTSTKHQLRNGLLNLLAKLPIPPQRGESGRVLIIRPDHLGDMLLTTPAINALKRARPERVIHVLCGPACADLLAHYDAVDQALTLPFPGFQRGGGISANPYRLAWQRARQLRQIGYDCAFVMRHDHWWGALLAYLAGIRQRVGYDVPGVAPFLTEARTLEREHAVKQNMRLVASVGDAPESAPIALDFPTSTKDREYIDNWLAQRDIGAEKPIACIHPGAGMPSKLWRPDYWATVADALAREQKAAIIFTGAPAEEALVADIVARMKAEAHSIAGATSIGQLAALYRRASLALGPDSGAMHLAAAVHAPTVTLFGPADPIEFAPWGDPRRHVVVASAIACRPCRILDWRGDEPDFHPCVRDITVEQVLAAAGAILDGD